MKFFQNLLSKSLPPIEKWAVENAHHTTPDDIIVAAVIQSFVKNFRDWTGCPHIAGDAKEAWKNAYYGSQHNGKRVTFSNEKIGVRIVREVCIKETYDKPTKYWYGATYVNDVQLSDAATQQMLHSYLNLRKRIVAMEQAAATAKANMDRNEQAWNLAEKLLGMKRNEFGALVPVKTAETVVEPEPEPKPEPPIINPHGLQGGCGGTIPTMTGGSGPNGMVGSGGSGAGGQSVYIKSKRERVKLGNS